MSETKTSTLTQAPPRAEQRTPPPQEPSAPSTENKAPQSRVIRILAIVGVILVALLIWRVFFASPSLPASIIGLSGRIEGDDSAVAPKTSGKILDITVREGDSVKAGDVIARLDDAQAQMQGARDQIAVLQEQLRQNQVQTTQSTTDAEGRVRQAQADLTAAEADLTQQEAALRLAQFNRDAYQR